MILRCRWSAEDKLRLIDNYPHLSMPELIALLCRTKDAIETKASDLGLKKGARTLARIRRSSQNKSPKQAGYFQSLAPDKPTEKPQDCMAGVRYEDVRLKRGVAVNGGRLARAVAHSP